MKCTRCGYEEEVPEWVLQELNEFSSPNSEYEMICTNCDRANMYPKASDHFKK